jgi:hypothetical protein
MEDAWGTACGFNPQSLPSSCSDAFRRSLLGRTPWWYRATIAHWLQVRPLRGQRGRGRPKGTGPTSEASSPTGS